jgi:SAM-dependent methyltransferase
VSARSLSLVCPRCRGPLDRDDRGYRCPACGVAYPERDGVLRVLEGDSGAPGYDPHYFGTLPQVEQKHFWFLHRREVILDALRRHVPDLARRPLLDLGCGSGGLMAYLGPEGVPLAAGCDAYVEGLLLARRRVDVPLVLVDLGRLPPLGPGQAMIGLFDVLEHLDDDRGVLRWLASVLEPGGVLVLTVPAHPFLFDEMDELAHHRRRYRRDELREKLEAAGFEVGVVAHFMGVLLPLLVLVRLLGRLLPARPRARRDLELRVVPVVNPLLRLLLRIERWVCRRTPLPFGTSLIAIAVRPRGGTVAAGAQP